MKLPHRAKPYTAVLLLEKIGGMPIFGANFRKILKKYEEWDIMEKI
jgi:hypothetical protein